jgi:hypothetical protein
MVDIIEDRDIKKEEVTESLFATMVYVVLR